MAVVTIREEEGEEGEEGDGDGEGMTMINAYCPSHSPYPTSPHPIENIPFLRVD